MKRSQLANLLFLLGSISACSGNVELEHSAPGSGSAGATSGCVGAGCPELTLSSERVGELLSDGTRLYWINNQQQLRGCVALNCSKSVVTYGASSGAGGSSRNRFRNFDFSDQRVIWRAAAGICSCLKSGCDTQQALLASDSALSFWGLSASGSDVYWGSDLDIYRCADTGCNSVPSALASGETTSMKLVFYGPNAYWISLDGIRRAPRDGSGTPTTIIASGTAGLNLHGVGAIDELGIDAEHLYWLGDSGHILSCPIAGCAPEDAKVLVPTEDGKQAFQVDASGLYWIDEVAERALVRCPLAGCTAPTPLTPAGVHDFALDEASVYWTEDSFDPRFGNLAVDGGINIRRIPKPSP